MLAKQLAKAWDARERQPLADAEMRFNAEGLVLGAGTVLAPAGRAPREVRVDPRDPRLAVLLTAAHLAPPTAVQLAHLAKAADSWQGGEDALAAMHLALSGLSRLVRPGADAHRLFLADGLLKAGINPSAVLAALEPLTKYDPDQPRVPAGSGRTSGEWTSGDEASTGGVSSGQRVPQPTAASAGLSGADAPPSLIYPPQTEVNPSTVTEVAAQQYATEFACEVAQVHCVDAAVDAAAGVPDAANENEPFTSITNCRKAAFACKALSWVTHNVPFLDGGGGVIFPHGGIVLISGGMVDRYIPPLNGRGSLR